MTVKKIITIGLIFTILCSVGLCYYLNNKVKALEEELSIAIENEKAYDLEKSSLEEENGMYKFTIEQLNYYNDSILQKMNDVRKKLNIKNSDLKQIQYISSEVVKKDTITFIDTLFVNKSLDIDTIVRDEWYAIKLGLKYPNIIITEPSFTSEKYVIINYKKETINPPKKCWLLRLFQKKHKVVRVEVVEKSPYIENKQNKFIEIVK